MLNVIGRFVTGGEIPSLAGKSDMLQDLCNFNRRKSWGADSFNEDKIHEIILSTTQLWVYSASSSSSQQERVDVDI